MHGPDCSFLPYSTRMGNCPLETIQKCTAKRGTEANFDVVVDMCRNHAMAAQNACKPILFEPMVMGIFFGGQQKQMRELEKQIAALSDAWNGKVVTWRKSNE